MVAVAERLGESFDFVRVDLYAIGGKVYFGELTQNPALGLDAFGDVEIDLELGEKWSYQPSSDRRPRLVKPYKGMRNLLGGLRPAVAMLAGL